LFHLAAGLLSAVLLPGPYLFLALACFVLYEGFESRCVMEYVGDLGEFLVGVFLGLGTMVFSTLFMPVVEGVDVGLKWATLFMLCAGVVFTLSSLACFLFSFNFIKNPSLTYRFAAEVFESAFLFTVATIFLIVGLVFLVYAVEVELKYGV
jgi:hypothetical protein